MPLHALLKAWRPTRIAACTRNHSIPLPPAPLPLPCGIAQRIAARRFCAARCTCFVPRIARCTLPPAHCGSLKRECRTTRTPLVAARHHAMLLPGTYLGASCHTPEAPAYCFFPSLLRFFMPLPLWRTVLVCATPHLKLLCITAVTPRAPRAFCAARFVKAHVYRAHSHALQLLQFAHAARRILDAWRAHLCRWPRSAHTATHRYFTHHMPCVLRKAVLLAPHCLPS